MAKRTNKQQPNQAARMQTQANATEFASETNVAQVRSQNQQSAARASQTNNPTE